MHKDINSMSKKREDSEWLKVRTQALCQFRSDEPSALQSKLLTRTKTVARSTMKFSKTIATASIILSFTSAGVLAAQSPTPISRAATPAAVATATPAAVPTSATELKPV